MELHKVKEFELGHVYMCQTDVYENHGICSGDLIGILAVSQNYDRHDEGISIRKTATLVVKIDDARYNSSIGMILGDWQAELFLFVDMSTVDVSVHNNYVVHMKACPSKFGVI